MRKLTSLMYLFVAATLLFTSCGGDEEDPEPQNPTFDFTASSSVKNGETVSVSPSEVVTLIITGGKADKNLKQVSFYEGENLISDASRITIGNEVQGSNPVDIKNAENSNFTWTVKLKAASTEGTNNYKVVLEDNDKLTATLSFTIVTTITSSASVPKLYSNLATASDAGTVGSFYSTKNNSTYARAAAAANVATLDFALNEPSNGSYKLVRPKNQTFSSSDANSATIQAGNDQTVFSSTALSFSSVTGAQLTAATATATEIAITSGSTYFFYNSNTGVRGLIKINSISTATDMISFDVKYITETAAVAVEEVKK